MSFLGGSSNHGYGDTSPSPDKEFKQMIIENNEEVFLSDLADFIQDKIWNDKQSIPKEQALKKAKEILEGRKETDLPPEINFDRNEHYEILKKAEQSGYLERFRLSLPWHVKPFLAREFVSFPYQHEYAILYRGTDRRIFEKRENTPEGVEQESVLEKGYIPVKDKKYLGFPNLAKAHAKKIQSQYGGEGIVLEIKVPTKRLETVVAPEVARKQQKGLMGMTENLSSLDELKNEFNEEGFDNPLEAFRYYCKVSAELDLDDTETNMLNAELVHFAVTQDINLDNILGIWDPNKSEKPSFEDADSYVKDYLNQ